MRLCLAMSGAVLSGFTLLVASLTPGSPSILASTNSELSAEREGDGHLSEGSGGGDPHLTENTPVPFSSRLVAAARALESRRADRLFNDPFAELLAGDAMQVSDYSAASQEASRSANDIVPGRPSDAAKSATDLITMFAIRTRFGDDFFEDCILSKGVKQVVFLGAGMDTRGLRLRATTGTTVFEVDQPLVLRVKNNLLAKQEDSFNSVSDERADDVVRARVVAVEVDLNQPGWERKLIDAGFDASLPSAWILEGFTMYLDEQELVSLLGVLSKLCSPGSAFFATSISREFIERSQAYKNVMGPIADDLEGMWKWGSDDPQAFFEDTFPTGWNFKGVKCGTPGTFPDGADYSVGFDEEAETFVVGYLNSTKPEPSSSEAEDPAKGEV